MESKVSLSYLIENHQTYNDTFDILDQFAKYFRQVEKELANQQLLTLIATLQEYPEQTKILVNRLCAWLCEMRLYPLLISSGILAREGFGREMRNRIYEKINPAFRDTQDLRDVFFLLFNKSEDQEWIEAIHFKTWSNLFKLFATYTTEAETERLYNHVKNEGIFAIKMLSIWIAAEDLEPELLRLDSSILNADSPFVALNREVMYWVEAQKQQQPFDKRHLQVMLSQSRKQISRLRKRGATVGSSLNVAYLLERLSQTLARLETLLAIFGSKKINHHRILWLTRHFALAAAKQHSIKDLWQTSSKMLARSITQNTSDHGEHYIARNKKEYWTIFYSAAGGGVLIALMALFKIYLGGQIDDKVWKSIAEGLNYGLGFTLIFMLHFTVATKQPAMTASRFAEAVEKGQGKTLNMKLAQLLIDVFRSQTIAIVGNVGMAIIIASLITLSYTHWTGTPLLDQAQIKYQLAAIDPCKGTLWFAAIAGVWLFCSGLITGFFENRSNFLNLRMRLRFHPMLKRVMSDVTREKFANYVHDNYGSIMGNFCFGLLLGLTGLFGYLLDLPLDIRHIAFSSANIGYAIVSGEFSWLLFFQSLLCVLLIGVINLAVSFYLTLRLALRSLGVEVDNWKDIFNAVWQIIKQKPMGLFFPI